MHKADAIKFFWLTSFKDKYGQVKVFCFLFTSVSFDESVVGMLIF